VRAVESYRNPNKPIDRQIRSCVNPCPIRSKIARVECNPRRLHEDGEDCSLSARPTFAIFVQPSAAAPVQVLDSAPPRNSPKHARPACPARDHHHLAPRGEVGRRPGEGDRLGTQQSPAAGSRESLTRIDPRDSRGILREDGELRCLIAPDLDVADRMPSSR
jgi:hypothetical protein